MSDNSDDFNLLPTPRVLRVLGEINLLVWRCLAELTDNSIDGYLHALRQGQDVDPLEVHILVPTRDDRDARVIVRDTGPGMDASILEKAVCAGWTGNDPVNNLGLFGMGFNIATARLGDRTTVWTTRAGDPTWVGLEIDFDIMVGQGHYRTPRLHRPKADPSEHGTEIIVERLKPAQRQWFSKPGNRTSLKKMLGQTYSTMLRPDGVPISFQLKINTLLVKGRRHCIWGGPESQPRQVQVVNHGTINAYQPVDHKLPDRPYCMRCWEWLAFDEKSCPRCQSAEGVIIRERRVHGWIGLQRYLSQSDYGIDFIRNGRKIEIGNKDLFKWLNSEGYAEDEYPIDDPNRRGRIVGEIHLDHGQVPYTKDQFLRHDPAWDEMVTIVRGNTSLRPERAKQVGQNHSPLFALYQAFRRSYPKKAKEVGGYSRHLAVPDNEIAVEMAERFYEGDTAYQADTKWWELVEEEDRRILEGREDATGNDTSDDTGSQDGLSGFGQSSPNDAPHGSSPDGFNPPSPVDAPAAANQTGTFTPLRPAPPRRPIFRLSRVYVDEVTDLKWKVKAYEVDPTDPGLGGREHPWRLTRTNKGEDEFLINKGHDIFKSATMTEVDALLYALTSATMDFHKSNRLSTVSPDVVLASLRERYATRSKLDPMTLASAAQSVLHDMARSLRANLEEGDGSSLFFDLIIDEREAILRKMAKRSISDPQPMIEDGSFLEYAPHDTLLRFFESHPELFFDGRYWDDVYSGLEGTYSADIEEAQDEKVRHYASLITDAIWLADQDPVDVAQASRERLLRARLAVDLLGDSVFVEND